MSRCAALFLSVVSLTGCYLSHEPVGGRPPGRRDGGPIPDSAIVLPDGRIVIPDSAIPRIDSGPPRDGAIARIDAFVPRIDAGPGRPALRLSRATYFDVEGELVYDFPDDSTFELWIRSREDGTRDYCQKGEEIEARDFIVGQRDGHLAVGWQFGEENIAIADDPLTIDRWTHVAMVRQLNGSSGTHDILLYVDGELAGSAFARHDLVRTFNVHALRCGFADVDVDEIRIWRTARTQEEIAGAMSRAISGGVSQLVSYWRVDEGGQLLLDYTGRGRVAVLGDLTTPDGDDPEWIFDGPF